ncbi:FG-GAP repeat domain-containing protein, partial [Amycolatopsis samaneae]
MTGSGWETATRVLEGDISGDGSMDLLSTTASGELRYFPNNGSSNAGGNPFNEYIVTGSGWGPEVTRMFLADFSGDGSADLLATKKDGTLLWCPNNRATNPGGAPFMTCSVTGSGWNTANRMFVADFSGDGSADLLATTESGELRYFPNNRSTNAGGNPFNEYQVTGSGWNSANRMFVADFSGDGSADLLSTTASGELRYFPNNGSTNAGHNPFNDYIVTGSGWNTANRMFVADFSGDGSADLLSTTASGELRYFPNNRATNPGGAPFNTYQTTGSG